MIEPDYAFVAAGIPHGDPALICAGHEPLAVGAEVGPCRRFAGLGDPTLLAVSRTAHAHLARGIAGCNEMIRPGGDHRYGAGVRDPMDRLREFVPAFVKQLVARWRGC